MKHLCKRLDKLEYGIVDHTSPTFFVSIKRENCKFSFLLVFGCYIFDGQ